MRGGRRLTHLLLAERMAGDPTVHGEAFNFSNEIPVVVLDLTERILVLMGRRDLRPRVLNQAMGEIREQCSQKAREPLGWKALYTLDEGLRLTIGRYREYLAHEPGARQ